MYKYELTEIHPIQRKIPFFTAFLGSAFLGLIIALFVGKLIINPIGNISSAFHELSKGNFNVHVSEKHALKEIREMARSFNQMAFDLSQVETLQNDFVSNVSHEFKTPIASIAGYAALLEDNNLTREKHDRYVEKILYNSQKLTNLSDNILLLSKIENQKALPVIKTYRLDEQIRKSILSLESKWTEKNIFFDMELPKVLYYGSEPLMERVWFNILDNAIKHSFVDGRIQIAVDESPEKITVCIQDQGEGMDAETQKHIFVKFYQGDESHAGEGNGLGLALVKRIVELCNGTVSVESELGKGARFTVTLLKSSCKNEL